MLKRTILAKNQPLTDFYAPIGPYYPDTEKNDIHSNHKVDLGFDYDNVMPHLLNFPY